MTDRGTFGAGVFKTRLYSLICVVRIVPDSILLAGLYRPIHTVNLPCNCSRPVSPIFLHSLILTSDIQLLIFVLHLIVLFLSGDVQLA